MSTTLTATIPLSVEADPAMYRLVIATPPTKTTYTEGDKLATAGIVVNLEKYTAKKGVIQTTNVTSSCTFNPANNATLTTSNKSIGITYTTTEVGSLTAQQTITVQEYWQDVINEVKSGSLALGNTRTLKLTDGTSMTVRVVDIATNGDVTFGATAIVENRVLVASKPSSSISYKDTDLRTYLNGTFYNKLPTAVKSAIKQKTITHKKGNGYNSSTKAYSYVNETSTNYVWIPSYNNLWGDYLINGSKPADNSSYAGWNTNEERLGWYKNNNETLKYWVSNMDTRYAGGGTYSNMYGCFSTLGTSTATTSGGVVPFFVISKS